jgi:hypothetical protein
MHAPQPSAKCINQAGYYTQFGIVWIIIYALLKSEMPLPNYRHALYTHSEQFIVRLQIFVLTTILRLFVSHQIKAWTRLF